MGGTTARGELAPTRCARPTLGPRKTSTYTVLGFTGYVVASAVALALSMMWSLSLADRVASLLLPPISFVLVVWSIRRWLGYERIVFYQTTAAALLPAIAASALTGGDTARVFDVVTLGVGTFLVFGRIGCFSVACCHGRLSRRGVVYGAKHAAAGFWSRWVGRPLVPIQLIEAAASLALVVTALAASRIPGRAGLVYVEGYALCRFALELARGDAARPLALGISEAQWTAFATTIACLTVFPSPAAVTVASTLALAIVVLVAMRGRRALVQPIHIRELDRAASAAIADGQRHETSLGIAISHSALPGGRHDWILSSAHPRWSSEIAKRLAHQLWPAFELVEGRLASVIHVIVPATRTAV